MTSSLLAQTESKNLIVLCESHPYAMCKHDAACEKARKAYLRAVHGFQPPKGNAFGHIRSAVTHGSIIVVEFRSISSRTGMVEVPLHVFKKSGVSLTSSTDLKIFVGRLVWLNVIGRYEFNGISLSNVSDICLYGDLKKLESEPGSLSVAVN